MRRACAASQRMATLVALDERGLHKEADSFDPGNSGGRRALLITATRAPSGTNGEILIRIGSGLRHLRFSCPRAFATPPGDGFDDAVALQHQPSTSGVARSRSRDSSTLARTLSRSGWVSFSFHFFTIPATSTVSTIPGFPAPTMLAAASEAGRVVNSSSLITIRSA